MKDVEEFHLLKLMGTSRIGEGSLPYREGLSRGAWLVLCDRARGARVIDVVNVLEDRENNTRYVTLSFPFEVHHRHRLLASRRLRDASAPAFREERYVRDQRPKILATVPALGSRV